MMQEIEQLSMSPQTPSETLPPADRQDAPAHDLSRPGAVANATGDSFTVVIVALSAGGIEALSDLFASFVHEPDVAFIIVQHLSAHFPSTLDEILSRKGPSRIAFVTEGEPLCPGRGYLVPSQKIVTLVSGKLHLEDLPATERGGAPLPANAVMEHFAAALGGRRLISVILSGTGEDGRAGASAVQKAGGQVLVQVPSTCAFAGMPQSVIDARIPCEVLPLAGIAESITKRSFVTEQSPVSDELHSGSDLTFCSNAQWERFARAFEQVLGVVPDEFVTKRVMNSLGSRMSALNVALFEDYIGQLESVSVEAAAFARHLMRPSAGACPLNELVAFAEAYVWPEFLKRERDPENLRVWVVSGDNGLDGIALAISLSMCLKKHLPSVPFRLFCTAINGHASPISGRGEILESDWMRLPAHIQAELLSSASGEKVLDPSLASRIVFASHSALVDPPFSQVSALFAVGLFEHLQPRMRYRVLSRLGFATRLRGLIVTSKSELSDLPEFCRVVADSGSLRAVVANNMRPFDEDVFFSRGRMVQKRGFGITGVRNISAEKEQDSASASRSLRSALFEEVASRLVPPTLVLTEDLRIVSHFGDFRDTLNVASLVPGAQLQVLFVEEHVAELEAGVRSCLVNDVTECLTLRSYNVNSVDLLLDVVVRKLSVRLERSLLFSVTFSPRHSVEAGQVDQWTQEELKDHFLRELSAHKTLRNELEQTRASLSHSLSQLEAVNEELQAANEELLAGTEELQSTNEELESVNEELYCVNSESQARLKELTRQIDAASSALHAQDVLVLTLDEGLNISWIFGPFLSCVGLRPQDVGRSIASFSFFNEYGVHRLALMALRTRLEQRQILTLPSGDPCVVAVVPVDLSVDGARRKAEGVARELVLSVFLPRFLMGRVEAIGPTHSDEDPGANPGRLVDLASAEAVDTDRSTLV
jgi:two-component system CheB/CheR fusion protein